MRLWVHSSWHYLIIPLVLFIISTSFICLCRGQEFCRLMMGTRSSLNSQMNIMMVTLPIQRPQLLDPLVKSSATLGNFCRTLYSQHPLSSQMMIMMVMLTNQRPQLLDLLGRSLATPGNSCRILSRDEPKKCGYNLTNKSWFNIWTAVMTFLVHHDII